MNATPQCYDYEVASPGWSFFYDNEALPDERLGIAQLSNRLLIPPDALPFQGDPNGEFLGYSYMALPFTEPVAGEPPTGDQAWTCFLSAANFKGPIAYYIPETWSKVGKLFNYPFLHGRGLRLCPRGWAATPWRSTRSRASTRQGLTRRRVFQDPQAALPGGRTGQDAAGPGCDLLLEGRASRRLQGLAGRRTRLLRPLRNDRGAGKSTLTTRTTKYDQDGKNLAGVDRVFDTRVFDGNLWGLEWFDSDISPKGTLPPVFQAGWPGACRRRGGRSCLRRHGCSRRSSRWRIAGEPYTSPTVAHGTRPGPASGPLPRPRLADGSLVTYSWYRFVDQPSFQQYAWNKEDRSPRYSALVERIHTTWPLDRDSDTAPPSQGRLVSLDPALSRDAPKGLEAGYVPIVTRQEAGPQAGK